jgi:fatty acid/phospholipid biosynthesis enzyme
LKNAEGVGKTILNTIALPASAKEEINHLFNYNDQGAAILLGPSKIILKAHGAATKDTIATSVEEFVRLDKGGLIEALKEEYTI